MCGISIAISKQKAPVAEQTIRCMTDCIVHRGPAGDGFYIYKNLALGHRRLAIIDTSAAGNQPMHWKDELTIIFNGEIYNYIELRKQLVQLGYTFTTQSDTEVILAAYHCWGQNCQQYFNGMWAFAILDQRNDTLFCSRDRFGVKPFYYTCNQDGFFAGSEIRQLLPLINSRKVNYQSIADYLLLNLSDHTNNTFFEEIKKLPGGHQLLFNLNTGDFTISQWYEMKFHPHINQMDEAAFLELFEVQSQRSVQWRMRSDVPVGTCLSGGLDSSYIAALSARQHKDANGKTAFNAITAQSLERDTDETAFAKQVADQYQLNWHVTKPTQKDFEAIIERVIDIQEEPFADLSVYMQYFVMQQAKAAGITVLLDGQGADESLLGYSRYIFQNLTGSGFWEKLLRLPAIKGKYGLGWKETFLQAFYFNNQKLRFSVQKSRYKYLKKEVLAVGKESLQPLENATYRQLQQQEMLWGNLPLLLRFEDKNSMHFSIEARLPFLDWELVETVFSMNDSLRFKNGWSKYILRKAEEKLLPTEIAWRKRKLGFVAPTDLWLAGSEKRMLESIKQSPFLKELFNGKVPQPTPKKQLWKLYNLHAWATHFKAHL